SRAFRSRRSFFSAALRLPPLPVIMPSCQANPATMRLLHTIHSIQPAPGTVPSSCASTNRTTSVISQSIPVAIKQTVLLCNAFRNMSYLVVSVAFSVIVLSVDLHPQRADVIPQRRSPVRLNVRFDNPQLHEPISVAVKPAFESS